MLFSINDAGQIVTVGETWKKDRDYQQDAAFNASPSRRGDCRDWVLHELELNGNRMPCCQLDNDAKDEGFSTATLRRAKEDLKKAGEIRYYSIGSGKSGKTWYVERVTIPNEWTK